MSEDAPLVRQWNLLRLMGSRAEGLAARELAEESGKSLKTIRRDLNLFRELGVPISESIGRRGRKTYRLDGAWNHPPLNFTFDEAFSLLLHGRRALC